MSKGKAKRNPGSRKGGGGGGGGGYRRWEKKE